MSEENSPKITDTKEEPIKKENNENDDINNKDINKDINEDINESMINENISMEIKPKKEVSFEEQKAFEAEVEKRVQEKYKEEPEKNENKEKKSNEKVFLTLENLLNIKTIIEAAVQRNAFKQEEMKDVIGNYEFFVKGLQTLIDSQK